jgi:hypothetical protein
VDDFKTTLKKKVDDTIQGEKSLATTPRSDKGGGKFNITIFS